MNLQIIRRHRGFFSAGMKLQTMDKGILLDLILRMVFRYLILTFLWRAVFQAQAQVTIWDESRFMKYIAASVFLSSLFSYPNVYFISQEIKSGNIVNHLSKPYRYPLSILMKNMGILCINVMVLLPVFLLYGLLFLRGISAETVLWFLISASLGVMNYLLFDISMGLLTFWTENGWGISLLKHAVLFFFTGKLFPLDFFPAFVQKILQFSPFQGMIYTPALLFSGAGRGSLLSLEIPLLWSVLLYGVMERLFAACGKRWTVNGG